MKSEKIEHKGVTYTAKITDSSEGRIGPLPDPDVIIKLLVTDDRYNDVSVGASLSKSAADEIKTRFGVSVEDFLFSLARSHITRNREQI